MKNATLLMLVCLFLTTSCRKKFKCVCTTEVVGILDGKLYDTIVGNEEEVDDTKKTAKKYCEGKNKTYRDVVAGVDYNTTCKLK